MIGIYGGTFDPIHFGHLRTVLEVKDSLGLSSVRLIPCHRPPHRKQPAASEQQRLQMLQLAINGEQGFEIDLQELQRPDISYTVDTLTAIRANHAKTPLCLIMGQDAFANFHLWHRWQAILQLAHLVIMKRPGETALYDERITDIIRHSINTDKQSLHNQLAGHILFQPVTQLDISATQIRQLLYSGNNPRYLLPEVVLQFIKQQKLYQSH